MELLIIAVIFIAAMWFMSSRQRKMQREAVSFRENLQPGQEVMTGSGLFGTVVAVEDDVVTLESTPGTQTRWLKAAIAKLVEPPVEDVDDDEVAEDEWEDEDTTADDAIEVPDDLSSLEQPRRGDDPDTKPQQ